MLLAQESNGSRAGQVAQEIEISLPTAYHLLNTLVAEGLLFKDSQRRYHLGPKIGALAEAFVQQVGPPEYLLAVVRELAETTGESAYLSGWRHGEIVVLASVDGTLAVRVSGVHLGSVGFAHARASGKLLLALAPGEVHERYLRDHRLEPLTPRTIVNRNDFEAELERVRKCGYATEEGEFSEDIACVSGPVIEGEGVTAALTISAPFERFRRRRKELIEAVLTVCRRASSEPERTVPRERREETR